MQSPVWDWPPTFAAPLFMPSAPTSPKRPRSVAKKSRASVTVAPVPTPAAEMAGAAFSDPIEIRGARQNNLKGFDLDLPTGQLIVVTGPSGSGKSSLAFDTLYAEGQRRYIETFSPYARQFFDRMDKPQRGQHPKASRPLLPSNSANARPLHALDRRHDDGDLRSHERFSSRASPRRCAQTATAAACGQARCAKDSPQHAFEQMLNAECGRAESWTFLITVRRITFGRELPVGRISRADPPATRLPAFVVGRRKS